MAFIGMSVAQDIYTAGYYTNTSGNHTAAVYKNGTKLYEMSGGNSTTFSYEAKDVACRNGDVFWVRDAMYADGSGICRGVVKKNNNSTNFLDEGADNKYYFNKIAIDYDGYTAVAGWKNDADNGNLYRAAVWTCSSSGNANATPHYLGNTSYSSFAYDVEWYDDEVYTCGSQYTSSSAYKGVVWKSYSTTPYLELPAGFTPRSIAISYDGKIYTAGVYSNGSTSSARVYENTTLKWSLASTDSRAWDIEIDDAGDIYVTGWVGSYLKVWKNGSEIHSISAGSSNSWAVTANTEGVYSAGKINSEGKIWKNGSVIYSPSNCEELYGIYVDAPECPSTATRSLPFNDGFEMGNTSWPCWTTIDVDNNNAANSYWHRAGANVTNYSGDYCARHCGNPSAYQNGWLITPRLFLQPGRDSYTLSFKSWVGSNMYTKVYVSTNSDPTATSSFQLVYDEQQQSQVWTTITIDLSAYQGEAIYIGFVYVGTINSAWLIDDVSVTEDWMPQSSPYEVPYTYTFNNWDINNTYWYIVDMDKSGGGYHWKYDATNQCARHPYGPQGVLQYGCLVSPNINLVAGHDYVLKFKHRSSYSGSNMSNKIFIKLDGTGTPNPATYLSQLWNDSNFPSDWTEVEIPLSSYAGHTISFSFEYYGTWAHIWYLKDFRVEESIAQYTITANANNNAWGTVTGGGTYNAGETCTLTATPASGYQFESWKKNGSVVSTNANYSFTVTENATYTAYFAEVPVTYYTITTNVTPTGAGTVTGGGTYPEGSSVTLTATANPGYTFSQWNDGNTQNPRTITVTGNATYTATFTQDNYIITVNASPTNGGTVTGGGAYHYGETATLTATPNTNFEFQGWSDGSTDNPRTITVTGNATYTAVFSEVGSVYYTITTNVDPVGAGTVSGGGTYEEGSVVTLTATANPGYTFDHWNDGSTQNPRTVTVNSSMSFTAYFNHNYYTITVNANPSNAGTVSGGGAYYYGDYATLMATAYSGYDFVGWSDGSNENPHQVLVTGNATYTATFSQSGMTYYTVSAYVSPTGAGTVSGTGTFPAGASTTLTATANPGYTFDHWNDGSTTNPRTVTVNNNMSFTAYFNTQQYTITVNANPSNGGTVTGGGTYAYGATATLTATPNTGFDFLQWSDGVTLSTRVITVTGNATYTALFSNGSGDMYTLTVRPNSPFLGETSGSGLYPAGSTVEISAYPSPYAIFIRWDDGNTQNPRTVVVNSNLEFVAEFGSMQQYTITVTSADENMGQAYGGGTFESGAQTQISAMAYEGYVFSKWNDNNTENPRTITVNGDATYTAYFTENSVVTYTVMLISNPDEGTVSGGGTYLAGATAIIQAFPNPGYVFSKWSDDNTDNPRTITVNDNVTLAAFFATGVDENEQANLQVYPNPAKESIRILGIEANSQIEIYNSLGELVKTLSVNPDQEIGIRDLASGLYLVRCGNVMLRFVKEQ